MLGPPKPRRLHEPIAASLEELVPQNHFYRHVEAQLDLSFVREWTRELYAERGRPSIDPVVFFKLQLVMLFEGIRSERQLIATYSLNLAHRWYLGYALDEALPDHSCLTRIRQRLGLDVFQRFFEQVVDLCQEAALVWGQELYFDATKTCLSLRHGRQIDCVVTHPSEQTRTSLIEPVQTQDIEARLRSHPAPLDGVAVRIQDRQPHPGQVRSVAGRPDDGTNSCTRQVHCLRCRCDRIARGD